MKKYIPFLFIAISLALAVIINSFVGSNVENEIKETPNDWFFLQRAFPYPEINYEARQLAWEQSQKIPSERNVRGEGWISSGPLNIGGRISTGKSRFSAGSRYGDLIDRPLIVPGARSSQMGSWR